MKNISHKVVERSFIYIRALTNISRQNKDVISSAELAGVTGLSDNTVRKDISHFRAVGKPGVGYEVSKLRNVLEDNVLHREVINVVLVGVGNLGQAILKYPGFSRERLNVIAGFDTDRSKCDRKINDVMIYPFSDFSEKMKTLSADIAVMAVPAISAQEVADRMVASGFKALVNFSAKALEVPERVFVKNIDLTIEFLSLYANARGIK